jgi:hypothetical protein
LEVKRWIQIRGCKMSLGWLIHSNTFHYNFRPLYTS